MCINTHIQNKHAQIKPIYGIHCDPQPQQAKNSITKYTQPIYSGSLLRSFFIECKAVVDTES